MARAMIPLKAVAKVINGFPFPSQQFDLTGHPLVRIRDIDSTVTETYFNGPWEPRAAIDTGDVLVGMDGDFNLSTWKGGPALLNQRVCCIRGKSDLWTRFLAYYLPPQLQAINDVTYATTVKHLASGDVERISVPGLEAAELNVILEYLDAKTAAIDALIAKKELLIEELKKYQEAVIAEAVRPREGWSVYKVKQLFKALPKSNMPSGAGDDTGAVPFYVSGEETKRVAEAMYRGTALLLADGGKATLHLAEGAFSWSDHVVCLVSPDSASTEFVFNQLWVQRELLDGQGFRGTGLPMLDKRWLYEDLSVHLPSCRNKTLELNATNREARDKTRRLIDNATSTIRELRVYRASLISEAVTGSLKLSD